MVENGLSSLESLPVLIGLLAALVVLLVVGSNLREGRRLRRLTDRVRARVEPQDGSTRDREDGLARGNLWQEPVVGPLDELERDQTSDEPSRQQAPASWSMSARPTGHDRLHADLSALNEWVVVFDTAGLDRVSHELILAQFPDWHRCGQKSVRFGLQGEHLAVGLLLATRQGSLSLSEYNQFVDRLAQGLAECPGVNAPAFLGGLDDFSAAHARSRERLRVLESLDGQLVFHLLSTGPMSSQNTSSFLLALGLTERGEGRFSRLDEQGEVLFSVLPGDQGFGLSYLLDLPRVANSEAVFSEMVELAQACAEGLSGQLVDDGRRALTPALFQGFASQVASRSQALRQAGFIPGSWLNRRIFF